MTDVRLIYVTTKDVEEARKLGQALLSEGLIACANILPQMESIYEWEGKVCQENEAVLILKTTSQKARAVIERTEKLHSYKTPCALSLAIEDGSQGYLNWIKRTLHP
jgi:periplasmic divalent cation tolerance protein